MHKIQKILVCQTVLFQNTKCFLEEYKHKKGVIALNKILINDIVKRFDHTLVEFAMKNCKQCDDLLPMLEQLNRAFHQQLDNPLPVTRFQCDHNPHYCQNVEDVKSYPTLRLYQNNKKVYSQYNGKLNINSIAGWINDRVFNSFIEVKPEKHFKQINEYVNRDGVLVFIYFGKTETDNWNIMKQFAFGHAHSAFYYTGNVEVLEKYEVSVGNLANAYKNGFFFVLKPHDEKLAIFNKKYTFDNLEDFYTENKEAMMHKFDLNFLKKLHTIDRPIQILLCKNTDEELLEEYLHVAHSYQGQEEVYFTHFDLTAKNNHFTTREIIEKSLGVDKHDMPTLRAIKPDRKLTNYNQTMLQSKVINKVTIKAYIRGLIRNQITPHKKSEKIHQQSKEYLENHQESVVRENFKELVSDSTQDIALLTTADHTYCHECADVEESLVKVRNELGNNSSIKFYKYNIYKNELEDWMFNRAPEIVYFNKDVSFADNLASLDKGFTYENVKSFVDFNMQDKQSNKGDL